MVLFYHVNLPSHHLLPSTISSSHSTNNQNNNNKEEDVRWYWSDLSSEISHFHNHPTNDEIEIDEDVRLSHFLSSSSSSFFFHLISQTQLQTQPDHITNSIIKDESEVKEEEEKEQPPPKKKKRRRRK